jgi:hypothetical protein
MVAPSPGHDDAKVSMVQSIRRWQQLRRSGNESRHPMPMKISFDTDTLFSNIQRHENQVKEERELQALEKLLACHRAGKIIMLSSIRRELDETKTVTKLDKLRMDFATS